jgi:hypothetical protein
MAVKLFPNTVNHIWNLQLRVFVANLIGFVWVVYVARKRRQARDQRGNRQ